MTNHQWLDRQENSKDLFVGTRVGFAYSKMG